jgi:hypothetical protein
MTPAESSALHHKIKKALKGAKWECMIDWHDADMPQDFEREGGKIIRRSQSNIIRAIHQFGFRFETDEMLSGEIRIRRPDDTFFYSNEDAPLKAVWLEVERRFGFLPAWTFFRTVFLDYAERNTVATSVQIELD